ncbi:class II glutamine amidotransferase [Nocardia sp. NPDC057227]|uniref:class II glutamine amidotransferase n=1 Tax=Nocardia sp. NPDC057227 TaxID=3346056 RepID=UPI003637C4F9
MCLLTYYPAGVAPDALTLAYGAVANPHGHGHAVLTDTAILTGHSMTAETAIAQFLTIRNQHPEGPALFHSRYATKGERGLGNCHPFYLGSDRRTVLAHNGTLPRRVHPSAYDPRSDTRIAAEDYLPRLPFGSIDTHRGYRGLTQWLGRSKLVILTIDPAYRQQAYLFGEQAGHWEAGAWHSNTSYMPPHQRWPPRSSRYTCEHCWHTDLHRIGPHCADCGWCFDCRPTIPDCTCLPLRGTVAGNRRTGPGRHRRAALPAPTS